MTVAAFIVGVLGLVLGVLNFTWNIANYLLTGGRVKVQLQVGARGAGGAVITGSQRMDDPQLKKLAEQGFPEPVVIVSATNVGRQPVTVVKWSLRSGKVSFQPVGDAIGPSLPKRLDAGEQATWALPAIRAHGLMYATSETLGSRYRAHAEVFLADQRVIRSSEEIS
ncbi:hypothetical protein [Cryptosporangium sp. NPDC048952]|uniref:hypothetical protein n=1 Tax=Cryptosporangium sp. NPDC048952 TaxID=3363961 RepID=UPI0037130603